MRAADWGAVGRAGQEAEGESLFCVQFMEAAGALLPQAHPGLTGTWFLSVGTGFAYA